MLLAREGLLSDPRAPAVLSGMPSRLLRPPDTLAVTGGCMVADLRTYEDF